MEVKGEILIRHYFWSRGGEQFQWKSGEVALLLFGSQQGDERSFES